MPFVKRDVTAPSTESRRPDDSSAPHIAALHSPDAETRWSAARALGGRADAVPALAAALGAEQVARVREAIMTALMRVGDEASVMALLPYLRSQDAAQRAASIEALQALPEAILPFMATLLADSDSDVRMLATELARNMPAADATRILCRLLRARAASQCLRRGDRRAGGGGDARRGARASGLRRTICRNAVSAIRRVDRHRPDFGHGTLGSEWQRSEAHGSRAVRVTPEEVRRLCEFLYRRTGMLFDDNKRYYIDRRLIERIAATGSDSFQAYFAVLRSDADHEIEHLINAFTVNETYFNREEHQLRCMTSDLLGNIIREKTAREIDPHLVDSLLDRRGALFDRDVADGELEPTSTATISRSSARTSIPARSRPRPKASTANAPSCGCRGM